MTLTILNVIYVLLAIAMIGFILVQRGAGAQAGSGFGGGASATVFGSRGAGNFLTKSTAILATAFFLLSLAMGMFISRGSVAAAGGEDLGVMGGATPAAAPAVPAADVPAIPAPAATAPAGDVPAAPAVMPGDAAAPAAAAPATEENSDQSATRQEDQSPKQ